MVYTEDLMSMLYDEALINGDAEQQIQKLASINGITVDEVLNILERNGCDVGDFKKKRGRPKKVSAEIKNHDIDGKRGQEKEVIKTGDLVCDKFDPVQPAAEQPSIEEKQNEIVPCVPKLIFDIARQKMKSNNDLISFYNKRVDTIKAEQDELDRFLATESFYQN